MKIVTRFFITSTIVHVALGFDFFDWSEKLVNSLESLFDLPQALLDKEWNIFKSQFDKSFHLFEELERYKIWLENKRLIEQFNNAKTSNLTYNQSINFFGDISLTQFSSRFTRTLLPDVETEIFDYQKSEKNQKTETILAQLPNSIDWRTKNVISPVQTQGNCGSCWAFSSLGAVESSLAIKTGNLTVLSAQNLVDCVPYGCQGGYISQAFTYMKNGINSAEVYPYTFSQNSLCEFNQAAIVEKVAGYQKITTESELEYAVAFIGPVACIVYVDTNFIFYKSGVFYDPNCSSSSPNHGVLVVGYGTDASGLEYWIVKNSWSATWGEDGYIRMARNRDNNCQIASFCYYPI